MREVTSKSAAHDDTTGRKWLPPAVLMAVVAWQAIRESGRLTIGDVFWHLRTGDLVLSDGPPREDAFSWTANGETWRPNAWLGDALWAGIRDLFGSAAVSLLVGGFVFGMALLLYRFSRKAGAGPWASVAATTAAIVFMSPFIVPRPLLLGLLLVPATVELFGGYRNGKRNTLLWTALVMVVWSNLHGSFVVGVALIAAMAGGWALDERTLKRPAAIVGTAFVAGLVNPYGFSSYVQTLVNRSESVTIEEWQPLALDDGRGLVVVIFMVLTGLALTRTPRWVKSGSGIRDGYWETLLPLTGLAVASFLMIRMAPFYLVIATPVVAVGLSALHVRRIRKWASSRVGPITTGLVLAGLILAAQQAPDLADAGKPAERFSEDLVAAIPPNCRLLNEYDLGGFIIDTRWPEVLVSQDGRADLYGLERLSTQEEWLSGTNVDVIEAQEIRCVLADTDRPLTAELRARNDWSVIGESSTLVLFERV